MRWQTVKMMLGIYPPGCTPARRNPLRWWQKAFGYAVALCAAAGGGAAAYLDATGQLPGIG
jgi:hypothetical protein